MAGAYGYGTVAVYTQRLDVGVLSPEPLRAEDHLPVCLDRPMYELRSVEFALHFRQMMLGVEATGAVAIWGTVITKNFGPNYYQPGVESSAVGSIAGLLPRA